MIWMDNALVLFMVNCDDGTGIVKSVRRRPRESFFNTKAAIEFFGSSFSKEVDMPRFAYLYNYNMGAVDSGD